ENVTEIPPAKGLRRLIAATKPENPAHPIDIWTLGEYAVLLVRDGKGAAAAAFPAVAAHLAIACATCAADLAELRFEIAREAEITRALTRESTVRRLIEETGADPALAADLEHYHHSRWDPA